MKYYFSLLLCLFISQINAQNVISGLLTNQDNQAPIPFANIYFPQLEKGTTTDETGAFQISEIPSGSFIIICSRMGFETLSQTITSPLKASLNLSLKPSAIEMEAVIISTPFHKLQSENVMKVEHKTMSELEQNGAVTLAEGLSSIPGVASVSTGLSIGKPVIRGLSSNRVLVYTQGIRLENQQFGAEHGLGLNAAGIESVEVIKGPASLLYGSDALGGVLYLNPEKFAPQNSDQGLVSAGYFTNTQGYNTSAAYKASNDAFKFLFRGSLIAHSDYNTKSYRVTNSRFKEEDFKAGIGYQKTNFKTEFRYNLNHSKLGIPEDISLQNNDKTPLAPYQDLNNHIFSSKSTFFFDKSSLNINLGYTYNDRKEFEDSPNPALFMKLKTANYDIKYDLPTWGKVETIVGMQGMNQINTNYGEEQLIPDAKTRDIGLFSTAHIHFKTIDVQLGARFDNRHLEVNGLLNTSFSSFNGALGLKTDLSKNAVMRLNLATGFRAPNLAELTSFGVHEGANRFEIGNIELKHEQNAQVDLALEYKTEHIEVFVNGFYNRILDYIYLSPDGTSMDDAPVFNYLQQNAKLYGGEIAVHLHPHPLDWLHLESSFESVTGKQDDGQFLPLIPAFNLSNTLRVKFDRQQKLERYFFLKLNSSFKQSQHSLFETTSDAYHLLNAGCGADFRVFKRLFSMSISANNIANTTYINHLSRLKSDGIYNMGRNISFQINYEL